MTHNEVDRDVRRRPADRPREAVLSLAVIVGCALVHAASVWPVAEGLDVETAIWLAPVLYVVALAAAVLLRARDATRRKWALGPLAALLAVMLVLPAIVLSGSVDLLWEHTWLFFEVSNGATTLLTIAAWGVARRHGRWWWLGLAPALGLSLAVQHVLPVLVQRAPGWSGDVALWMAGPLTLLLGGAACWLVDVLTTRPRARVGVAGLEHEHA
ncbi:hypothetical protein GCM10023339_34080 [Alloalcanivorax gelatiniphagus]